MKKYLSIYEKFKTDIIAGVYKYKTKLPSKRVVADRENVSLITVEHAFDLLIDEGYIETKEKSGYFVSYNANDFFAGEYISKENANSDDNVNDKDNNKQGKADNQIQSVKEGLNKGINDGSYSKSSSKKNDLLPAEPDYISEDLLAKTVRKVLSMNLEDLYEKSSSFGDYRLRNSISAYLLRTRHIKIEPERIVIGAGAEYLYGMIAKTLGDDKTYGIETPGYRKIKEIYSIENVNVELLKMGKDGILSSELWNSNANVLHITPYRSYPSFVSASAGKKREYLKWAKEKKAILIEDDYDSEFTPLKKSEDTLFSMDDSDSVIYVNTFSRTILPSFRMAYMLIPNKLIDSFKEKIGIYSCPVSVLDQLTVSTLIDNGDFERHINRERRKMRERLMKKG